MKAKLLPLFLVAAAALLSGCMSIGSKLSKESQLGYAYSGVTGDVLGVRCLSTLPQTAKDESNTSHFVTVPVSLVGSLLYVVDLPLSAIVDTLLLPVDLLTRPTKAAWSVTTTSCDRVHI